MSAKGLGSRAIVGYIMDALDQPQNTWVDAVSNLFTSDQESETYKWLGTSPIMREWIGGRQAKGFRENGFTIKNKTFEATLEVMLDEIRRDKTGQVMARIRQMAERAQDHDAKLLSALIVGGEAALCYDGQFFFDTDHVEGASGTQSNDLTLDVTTPSAPTASDVEKAILAATEKMLGYKDDQGEPINEDAKSFLVMVPVGLMPAATSALSKTNDIGPGMFSFDGFEVALAVNPRLTAGGWTDEFVTFRTDGSIKPLIRQEETAPAVKVKDENSEFAFDNDAIQVGIDSWRNVGYGRWQGAVLNTLV